MMPMRADAGSREIENDGRAEAAGADDEHARGLELLLALAADLLQDEVALVALDFLGRKPGGRSILHAGNVA